MKDFVVACAAGYYDKTPLVGSYPDKLLCSYFLADLNFFEDSSGSPDMPVAILPKSGTITMLQMDSKLHVETFETVCFPGNRKTYFQVMECAVDGCQKIYEVLLSAVRSRTQELVNSNSSI